MGLDGAVEAAVARCIEEGVLADYLAGHRAEAIDMLFTMEDEERAMRVHWEAVDREARERGLEQGIEQGIEQGLEQGKLRMLAELVRDGVLSVEDAAGRAGMPPDRFAASINAEDACS